MAFEYLAFDFSQNTSDNDAQTRDKRMLRDMENPFDLSTEEFRKLYRFTPEMAHELVHQVDGDLRGSRVTALSTEKQVLAALRFYATGCYQRPVGEQWGISMSQPSISRCIHRVTYAINKNLLFSNVKFPMTHIERQAAKATFASAAAPFVGGTIGAIDCSHVSILAPRSHEEAYVNHHGYHSLNVQMICDPNLKILNVNAKFPGARHDSYIWNSSAVRRVMQRSFENGQHNMFLIGDSGYPLEPWLMTPLPNHPEGSPKFLYNEALCKARNPIERLFGVLKAMWRCLSGQRTLLYDPVFVGMVVNACATLHNIYLAHKRQEEWEEFLDFEFLEYNTDTIDSETANTISSVAKRIQDRLITNNFT